LHEVWQALQKGEKVGHAEDEKNQGRIFTGWVAKGQKHFLMVNL
jgi:hypothetical protein